VGVPVEVEEAGRAVGVWPGVRLWNGVDEVVRVKVVVGVGGSVGVWEAVRVI